MHQILGHNGLPQQPSTANLYLPAGAAAPGVKFPIPQLKQGANAGNPAHVGIPSAYGSYGSSHVGFSHVPAVTSGNSTSNEDLGPAQLKENIYTTVPLVGLLLSFLCLYNIYIYIFYVVWLLINC